MAVNNRSSDGHLDNRLVLWDEAMVRTNRATGRVQLMQCLWIYERPVDMDGVRRFHRNFGYGMAGRRIERSPLPFGRYRWVAALGPASPLHIATDPLPREQLSDWADEWTQMHVDPEHGPGWHLGVQPFTDGATAICLVGSHCLGDGVAGLLAVGAAVTGANVDLGYPPPLSRGTGRAVVEDLRETVRAVPEMARIAKKAVQVLRASGGDSAKTTSATTGSPMPVRPAVADADELVIVPAIAVWLDIADWDARAETLGANSYSLLAGVAAKMGERMGRIGADGNVSLLIALSDRADGDHRANAMSLVSTKVDPANVTKDLTETRAGLRNALKSTQDEPDALLELLPLTPLVPKRLVKRVADMMVGSSDRPVVCSNLGELPTVVTSVDGTEADYSVFRGVDQAVSRGELEQGDGQLVLVSCRVGGKIGIGIVAYQTGVENSKARLRSLAAETLSEFDLTGVTD